MPDRDPTHVMSLHSKWAQAIYAGRKPYEFRRGAPRLAAGDVVLIYETKPTGLVTGRFEVAAVVEDSPEALVALEPDREARAQVATYLAPSKGRRCCAYRIEAVRRLPAALSLAQLGIHHTVMSYQRLPARD